MGSKDPLEMQLDPMGPIASREVSVAVFLRKPIITCDLTGKGYPPVPLWIRHWMDNAITLSHPSSEEGNKYSNAI